MSSRIRLWSVAVVPPSVGELENALFNRTRADSQLRFAEQRRWLFPVFVRNVQSLWIPGSQKAMEWGEPERDLINFHALGGSGLPSRSARSSSHLVLRASPKSRLSLPHAARYSSRFVCTIPLGVAQFDGVSLFNCTIYIGLLRYCNKCKKQVKWEKLYFAQVLEKDM